MLSQLPPLCVDSMTQVQLAEFIPKLIQLVTGRQHPFFGKSQFRPEWWPEDIPWANPEVVNDENRKSDESHMETLRKVIRSCYKHKGQENLLSSLNLQQDVLKTNGDFPVQNSKVLSAHDENMSVCNMEKVQGVFSHDSDNPKSPAELLNNMPIWVCFLCAKQFSHQDELMTHQEMCEQNAEKEEESVVPKVPVVPVVLRKVIKRKRRRRFKPEQYIPPPLTVFIQVLDLMEKPKDNTEMVSPHKKDVESDCEIIEVSDYEQSGPVTPRTPKSLMSQLSRDGDSSGRKRHLSFSQALYDSESGDESESHKQPVPAINSLLYGIDLCSPLGVKVKKHLKIEDAVPVVRNFEKYCCGPEKNEFIEKLRQRDSSYPVVFKQRKKFATRFFHRYKFNSADRREFMMKLKTGLTKQGRQLLSEMKPCSVKLKRLKPDVIKEWCRPKPRKFPCSVPNWYQRARNMLPGRNRPFFPPPGNRPMYRPPFSGFMNRNNRLSGPSRFQGPITPNHPAFQEALTKPVFGPKSARIKQINQNIAHLNQGSTQYMVTQVITNPDGTETMKIVCVAGNPKPSAKPYQGPSSPVSRRKQTFNQERMKQLDDEIVIIEMSSSEDEDETSTKPQKCKFCDLKTGRRCPKHGGKPQVPSVVNHGGNMYLSRPFEAAGSHIASSNSASSMKTGTAIHSSPPGGRTITELGLSNIRNSISQSAATRNIQFGNSRIGNLSSVHNPGNLHSQSPPSDNIKSKPVLQSLLKAPNDFLMQPRVVSGPQGERLYISRNEPDGNKSSPPVQRPVLKVPNYSIEKKTISDKDQTEVDVICIDDDDD